MDIKDRILKVAAGIAIVREKVDQHVADERMSVCMGCEHRDADKNKCKVCSCFLDLKTQSGTNWRPSKNRIEITHCPLGKWGDLQTANEYRLLDGLQLLNQ